MHSGTLGVGKLPMDLLQSLLERYAGHDERLVVGPRVGEDAAVLDMGERYLVVKSDPITFATDEIGWYVVQVNANDIATRGAQPRWFLLTLLLPERRTSSDLVEQIFGQVGEACRALGITLCGGHTEITAGLDRPIAVGLMLGEVETATLVCTAGAQPGDHVILTKGIAIEGTAVLARELGDRLAKQLDPRLMSRCRQFLHDPGISVLREAELLCQAGQPHAMHDPTEGGLATGLWELALASGHGMVVDLEKIHLFPETAAVCQALELDPLGLLASGALLAAVAPEDSGPMLAVLGAAGIRAEVIGQMVEGPPEVVARSAAGLEPLRTFERDELAGVFARDDRS